MPYHVCTRFPVCLLANTLAGGIGTSEESSFTTGKLTSGGITVM